MAEADPQLASAAAEAESLPPKPQRNWGRLLLMLSLPLLLLIGGAVYWRSLQGQVSWVSPIARTLLKSREGDELKLVTPAGVMDIEVLQVNYPTPA